MMTTYQPVETARDRVLDLIRDDVAAGLVPWDVPDFSALHDFVDANEYLIEVLPLPLAELTEAELTDEADWLNEVSGTVNQLLNGGRGKFWAVWRVDEAGYIAWCNAARERLGRTPRYLRLQGDRS
jgi:hypothetical protein